MMVCQVEIKLLLLADRVGAEGALKTKIRLVVLLVVFEGACCLEVARGAENCQVLWLRTVIGSVDVLVSLLQNQIQFQPGFLNWPEIWEEILIKLTE